MPPKQQLLSLRILVVERVDLVGRALSLIFKQLGHTVSIAHNSAEAVESLSIIQFDIVIIGVNLPDGSGLDLLGRLNCQRLSYLIAMSSDPGENDLKAAKALGFHEFLRKPSTLARVNAIVKNCVAYRNGLAAASGSSSQ